MKKILFATFFSAAAALSFSSCMNGDYDANPSTTNSNSNPLNTGGSSSGTGGGTGAGAVAKGHTIITIGGTTYDLPTCYFSDLPAPQRALNAGGLANGKVHNLALVLEAYHGVGTYNLTTSLSEGAYGYLENSIMTQWDVDANHSGTSGSVTVTSDASDEMKGTFSFTGKRVQGSTGSDMPVITGSFDATKM